MDKKSYRTFLDTLANEIRELAEEEAIETPNAAVRVIARRFGYDIDEIEFVDGAGDRGIDFWHNSDNGLYIYQVKTHRLTDRGFIDPKIKFDNEGVVDLMRAEKFLMHGSLVVEDHRLNNVKRTLDSLVYDYKARFNDFDSPRQRKRYLMENPLQIGLNLIILGEELTEPAFNELADFSTSLSELREYDGVFLQLFVNFQNIDDIIEAAWREENRDWKDINGTVKEKIELSPMRQAQGQDFLTDNQSAIFYCRAIDLVNAYNELGYQIFEPNVRANIKNSGVNDAIRESASRTRSMKEFRFLNNGITMTCDGYSTPSQQRNSFMVTKPGVVNGLQTVEALAQAYRILSPDKKKSFDKDCYVFVRLLRNDAVAQITDVVLATNNQNTMQPRNLKSNLREQRHFFTFFANELGWFYEAKEGAWDAFEKDYRRWQPRLNKRPKLFKTRNGLKKIDNQDLAQDWLAFLGFAANARKDKRRLFDSDKNYYKLLFLSRPRKHAYGNYRSIGDALKECEDDYPDPHLMLTAHLTRHFVKKVVPTAQANKKAALQRRGISDDKKLQREEEAKILFEDDEFVLNQALNAMSLVFVEYVGYVLFRIFDEDVHRLGREILKTESWNALAADLNWRTGVKKVDGTDKNLANNDLLVIIWLFFREGVADLMSGAWKEQYRLDRYRTDFLLNNRNQLYRELEKIDESYRMRLPNKVWWLRDYQDGEGFFGYLRRVSGRA